MARFCLPGVHKTPPKSAKVELTSGGNVGIGTTDPDRTLHVVGTIKTTGTRSATQFYGPTTTDMYYFVEPDGSATGVVDTGVFNAANASYSNRLNIDASVVALQTRSGGNVGIGTSNPQSTLAVNGTITAREVQVTVSGWPDRVLRSGYPLRTLAEVEQYVSAHGHLPDVPSEKEVLRSGINLGAMDALLLKKIEELTLYVIQLKKQNDKLKSQMAAFAREQRGTHVSSAGETRKSSDGAS